MAVAYRYYRLTFSKNSAATLTYYTINTLSLFASIDGTGTDLARAGVVSANGNYSASTLATNVNDGNDSTFWESSDRVAAGSLAMLTIDLGAAYVIRSLRIISTQYPNERPRDFRLEGSTDGIAWVEIVRFVDFMLTAGPANRLNPLWQQVRGQSRLDNGNAASRVLIYNWSSGALLATISPDPSGNWSWPADAIDPVLVVHTGPAGYRPICDGPITPAEV